MQAAFGPVHHRGLVGGTPGAVHGISSFLSACLQAWNHEYVVCWGHSQDPRQMPSIHGGGAALLQELSRPQAKREL